MAKNKDNITRCRKPGCDSHVAGKDSYECEKHEYQKYHAVFFKNRQAVAISDQKTWGEIL